MNARRDRLVRLLPAAGTVLAIALAAVALGLPFTAGYHVGRARRAA